MSVNDRKALAVWDASVHVVNGHYELDIPFKQTPPTLPDNRKMVERRPGYLRRKIENNPEFGEKYKAGINEYIKEGYAVR